MGDPEASRYKAFGYKSRLSFLVPIVFSAHLWAFYTLLAYISLHCWHFYLPWIPDNFDKFDMRINCLIITILPRAEKSIWLCWVIHKHSKSSVDPNIIWQCEQENNIGAMWSEFQAWRGEKEEKIVDARHVRGNQQARYKQCNLADAILSWIYMLNIDPGYGSRPAHGINAITTTPCKTGESYQKSKKPSLLRLGPGQVDSTNYVLDIVHK